MLLNRRNCLDKGYVALISSSNGGVTLGNISLDMLRGVPVEELVHLASATMAIKCPLFVQLSLSKFGFDIINMPVDAVEAFIPDLTDIDSGDMEIDKEIAADLTRTTHALLINPIAYQKDGCDPFVSQVVTPISVYNELIVHGSLERWMKFLKSKDIPFVAKDYWNAVHEILTNEWKNIKF